MYQTRQNILYTWGLFDRIWRSNGRRRNCHRPLRIRTYVNALLLCQAFQAVPTHTLKYINVQQIYEHFLCIKYREFSYQFSNELRIYTKIEYKKYTIGRNAN